MKNYNVALTLLLFFCYSIKAETLNLVVGLSKPPYVLQDSNSGFELELVRNIAKQLDYDVNFLYVPFGRTPSMLTKNGVDGILTTNIYTIQDEKFLTTPYITYQNAVITLKDTKFDFKKLSDLAQHSFVAFQNASKLLGPKYLQATQKAKLYLEVPDQMRQLKLLFQKKVDAVVIDVNIFNRLLSLYPDDDVAPHRIHNVFAPTYYSLSFSNTSLINAFNGEITRYIGTGEYVNLMRKYNVTQVNLADKPL